MESKYSTKDITKAVLLVAAVGVLVPALVVAPGLGYALKPFIKRNYYPSRINKTVDRLKKQELISIKHQNDGKISIELSDKGKKKVLTYKLQELKLKQEKWDGWWRIVIFDVPEKKRSARDFLRFKLTELNFYTLQKSVLVTPWDCRDVVDFVKHIYGVGDCVNLILAKKFDGEEVVRDYFDV